MTGTQKMQITDDAILKIGVVVLAAFTHWFRIISKGTHAKPQTIFARCILAGLIAGAFYDLFAKNFADGIRSSGSIALSVGVGYLGMQAFAPLLRALGGFLGVDLLDDGSKK